MTNFKYYNSGNLGIVGIPLNDIKQKNGKYTFLLGRQNQWIETKDLYNSYDQANNSQVAKFLSYEQRRNN